MSDQADTLRRLMRDHDGTAPSTRVVAFSSAKPRAGQTTLVLNLGAILNRGGAGLVLIDADEDTRLNPRDRHVLVMTGEAAALPESYTRLKVLRRQWGVTRLGVVVNQVTHAAEARNAFARLNGMAAKFTDVQLDYLGHCPWDEKIAEASAKRKFLLDLDSGAASVPCLELLAKRLSGDALSSPSRFMEEPAPEAPGNTARFWRTLFGEVKT